MTKHVFRLIQQNCMTITHLVETTIYSITLTVLLLLYNSYNILNTYILLKCYSNEQILVLEDI